MVFLSPLNFARVAHRHFKDKFWKRQQIFRLSANFSGRKRNCYSIAIRSVLKALLHAARGRKQKKIVTAEIWKQRLSAGCEELGYDYGTLLVGMVKSDIVLNRKSLADLAIWEPRTFKCLVGIAATKHYSECMNRGVTTAKPPPEGVITRGML